MSLPESKLIYHQTKQFTKGLTIYGIPSKIKVNLRFDDECKNGHNTFSITSDLYEKGRWVSGGCQHELVEKYFPELQHLIKWHLVSTDGPLHYLANTLYFAGDKDCNGKRKGEPLHFDKRLYFENFPIQQKVDKRLIDFIETHPNFKECFIMSIRHKDYETYGAKFTIIPGTNEWYKCEFDTLQEAEETLLALKTIPFEIISVPTSFSKGKDPELESARHSAIAPEATLDQLQDKEWLLERLPALMLKFKKDMEEIGFTY